MGGIALQNFATRDYVAEPRPIAAAQLIPRRQALIPGEAPDVFVSPVESPPASPFVMQSQPYQPQALVPTGDVIANVNRADPGGDVSFLSRVGGALKGAVGGFLTGGPTGAAIGATTGLIGGGGARARPNPTPVTSMTTALVPRASSQCPPGSVGIPPACLNLPGGQVTGGGPLLTYGESVMARYGAALVPATKSVTVRRCPKGAVLANDGYCYNKRDVSRANRMWNPGRKPLLTGGDLNAIARAARAATRMKTQQRRLERLGLLKKPSRGRGGSSRGVITKAEASRALRA